jgi:hypothetical protein
MRTSFHLLGLLGLLPAAGCYSYRSIRLEEVRPDLDVRLHVTAEGAGRVATVMGYLTEDVSGTVVSVGADTLLLSVATPVAPESRTIQVLHQQLDLPVSQVVEAQQRTFNRGKTYASIALGVAGAATVAVWGFTGVFGGSSGDRPPPVNNRLVPARLLLRLGHVPLGR